MEEGDELRMKTGALAPPTQNHSPDVTNKSSKDREEGELSSTDDDDLPAASVSQFNATTSGQEEVVRVASLNNIADGGKEGWHC
ncbi:hypothetical protein U1Q18_022141 [Sarracenia purpurea var. burkii]